MVRYRVVIHRYIGTVVRYGVCGTDCGTLVRYSVKYGGTVWYGMVLSCHGTERYGMFLWWYGVVRYAFIATRYGTILCGGTV